MYRIGFANQDKRNPFAMRLQQQLEKQIAEVEDMELIVRDNAADTDTACANCEAFANMPVDVAIIFHIDERAGMQVSKPLRMKGIPVISIDIPIPLTVFMGIDGYCAGQEAGKVLAEAIQQHWEGRIEKILVVTDQRVPGIVQNRFQGALDALAARIEIDEDHTLRLDGSSLQATTLERVLALLNTGWLKETRIAVICLNDLTAMGVLKAARLLNREKHMMIASFDGTADAFAEFQTPGSRLLVSPLFPPDEYARTLITLSRQLIQKERIPRKHLIAPICITRHNYQDFLRPEA